MPKSEVSKFRFRRLDNIGSSDAESDSTFLKTCFVHKPELDIMRDLGDHRKILLGRTGTGKTALFRRLAELEERVIQLKPESLSLSYISNSTILTFLSSLGVQLDIFFKLLWRHIITVEILKRHFHIDSESAKSTWLSSLSNIFKSKKHSQALKYLEDWGKSFWQETEYRIKELTTKLETNLRDAVMAKLPILKFTTDEAEALTTEQRQEVVQRAQYVVNDVQIKQLSDIIDLVAEALNDPQKRYYITIDRLDENWVDDRLRLRLIRALIETSRDFHKVLHLKIIIAIRVDLLDRMFKLTRDAGFQEEKYQSLYIPLSWTREELIEVLERRVNHLIKQRYTTKKVSYADVLPKSVDGRRIIEYLLDRTLQRPRDIIAFFNHCIEEATDKAQITLTMIRQGEGEYSRNRLRSLADEWYSEHPYLMHCAGMLKEREAIFRVMDITDAEVVDTCLSVATELDKKHDAIFGIALSVVESGLEPLAFKKQMFHVLYKVGLVGLKVEAFEKLKWITNGRPDISISEITEETQVGIHPTFWRVLGVRG